MSDKPTFPKIVTVEGRSGVSRAIRELRSAHRKTAPAGELVEGPQLGSRGKLIKRWRLPPKDGEVEVEVAMPGGRVDKHHAGLYYDPTSNKLYARVPEQEDGALYAWDLGETRADAARELKRLLQAWADSTVIVPKDTRTWVRILRVSYPKAVSSTPNWRGDRDKSGGGQYPWERPPYYTEPQPYERPEGTYNHSWNSTLATSDVVGPVRYARLEWAPRPGDKRDRVDVREWEEDYEERLRRWEARRDRSSGTQKKPQRNQATEYWPKGKYKKAHNQCGRQLAWDPEIWASLERFRAQFHRLDAGVRLLLLESNESLQARLLATPRLAAPE
jgi:hypothetical protein